MSAKPSGVAGNLLSLTLSVLLVVVLAAPSTAQQIGRVEGTVVQADNGEPVGGVRVTVVGTNIATLACILPRYLRWCQHLGSFFALHVRRNDMETASPRNGKIT